MSNTLTDDTEAQYTLGKIDVIKRANGSQIMVKGYPHIDNINGQLYRSLEITCITCIYFLSPIVNTHSEKHMTRKAFGLHIICYSLFQWSSSNLKAVYQVTQMLFSAGELSDKSVGSRSGGNQAKLPSLIFKTFVSGQDINTRQHSYRCVSLTSSHGKTEEVLSIWAIFVNNHQIDRPRYSGFRVAMNSLT